MKKKLYLCDPKHFDVLYELDTNDHMDLNDRPDPPIAAMQWARLALRCEELAEVHFAPSHPELPDKTFFANAGLPYKNLLIMSNFYHEERRREHGSNLKFFRNHFYDEQIWVLSDGAFFEGQGDAAWFNEETLAIGYGIRTNLKGVKEVERILHEYDRKIKVVPVLMRKQGFYYHKDTCHFWLPKLETSLIYPRAFEPEGIEALKKLGSVGMLTDEEASHFTCNGLVVDDDTIFMPWINDRIRGIINSAGYGNIEIFPMSEFMKSGGAVKCLMLEHNFPLGQH